MLKEVWKRRGVFMFFKYSGFYGRALGHPYVGKKREEGVFSSCASKKKVKMSREKVEI